MASSRCECSSAVSRPSASASLRTEAARPRSASDIRSRASSLALSEFIPPLWPRLSGRPGPVGRLYICLAAVRADNAGSHLVHHVRDGHPAAQIHDDDRATPPAPETDPLVRDVGDGVELRQAEPDAEAKRYPQHQVDAVGLLVEDQIDGVLP